MFPSFQLSNFPMWCSRFDCFYFIFILLSFDTWEPLHRMFWFVLCACLDICLCVCVCLFKCVIVTMAFDKLLPAIDHELQFVYARFDFCRMRCASNQLTLNHLSEDKSSASQAVKPNYCAHSSMFCTEVDCTHIQCVWARVHPNHTQSCVHPRIINYV